MLTLRALVLLAGLLHFTLLIPGSLVPIVLDWRRSLLSLHPFNRLMVWTYISFVGLTIVGFGCICVSQSEALAGGSGLARGVCAFMAVFWSVRLLLQLFVMDIRSIVRSRFLLLGNKVLTLVFVYFAIVFWIAAVAPRLLA